MPMSRGGRAWLGVWLVLVSSTGTLVAGCGGRNDAGSTADGKGDQAQERQPRSRPEASMPDAGSERMAPGAGDAAMRASVDLVLMAHHISPDESLAVRLLGTVGPDGSWALDAVGVRREPARIVLEPRVRRVEGDMFTQMVIPLDRIVKLDLDPGVHRIEVLCRDSVFVDAVVVSPDVRRAAPVAELGPASDVRSVQVGTETIATLPFAARVADGWIERVELREAAAGQVSPWRAPEMLQRAEDGGVRGATTLRRPHRDAARRIELRAIDGQGVVSDVVSMDLPPL